MAMSPCTERHSCLDAPLQILSVLVVGTRHSSETHSLDTPHFMESMQRTT